VSSHQDWQAAASQIGGVLQTDLFDEATNVISKENKKKTLAPIVREYSSAWK
jgi:hypothetical protein